MTNLLWCYGIPNPQNHATICNPWDIHELFFMEWPTRSHISCNTLTLLIPSWHWFFTNPTYEKCLSYKGIILMTPNDVRGEGKSGRSIVNQFHLMRTNWTELITNLRGAWMLCLSSTNCCEPKSKARRRRSYCIQMCLSFVQHKTLEIVCNSNLQYS